MPDVAFAFEHAEDGPDTRVTRLIGQALLDFSSAGASHGEENVHDLTLAPAEGCIVMVCHFRDASMARRIASTTTSGWLISIE